MSKILGSKISGPKISGPDTHRTRLTLGAAMLIAALSLCLMSSHLMAETPDAATAADPVAGGALMLRGKGVSAALPAVRLGTDMNVSVTGQIARVRVTQAFRNTSSRWMEATYLYPLPDDGAVDSLKMVVGQKVFIGHIKRREEARVLYEKAKEQGQKAGLVESARANLFRNSVANVGPGETVVIAIEYQAPVRQLGGEYALRLPLVAGPRYVPPHSLTDENGNPDPAKIADAQDVTAPIAVPSLGAALNPVSISVRLAPGFRPANIISPYHRIAIHEDNAEERTIRLAGGQAPADRDFELRWRSASADPTIALFREERGGEQYLMAAITPPAPDRIPAVPPREMVFVIDNSGSMGGASMRAAKESLLYALDTLRPQDRFNIIRFDDSMTQLFDRSTPASADQIALARRFTEGLEASGGTEMLPALKAALVDREGNTAGEGVRQIVFLTDGDLSNEREMMEEIAAHGGRSRLFMVGIGSAPNSFLMRRMAEGGRGTYTHIGADKEVMARMTALLDRLKAPVVQNVAVTVDGAPLDLTPQTLPDLYAGEPLTLLGRGKALDGILTVSGTIAGKSWSQRVDLSAARPSPSIAKLWANRRIAEVEAQRWSRQMEEDAASEAIARLGLDYGLVTRETSLVAIDETPSRPEGARLTREELPLLLPAGWDFDRLFGGAVPLPAAGAADSGTLPADQAEALDLPATATGFTTMILRGLALLMLGLAGLYLARPRKAEAGA
ncbi:MAG: marine proteobacterial sortase target protein [Sphingobium sp.]